MTGTQELLILLGAVIVWPVLWALMTGGPIWTDYPWGLVAVVLAAFLYLTPIKRGLLTGIIYLAWLIVIRHLIGLQVVGRQLVPRPMVRQRLVSTLNPGH